MTWGYYLKNIGWALFFLALLIYDWNKDPEEKKMQALLIMSVPSSILYPFCKIGIETLVLRFTTKEFWHRGFFKDTSGKSGLYALYYLFCFVFAIPIGLLYITYLIGFKRPHKRPFH